MLRDAKPRLCIHGHFYQPPREDPFTGEDRREPSAAPYYNWNERITAECYTPLAVTGCFDKISFNLGETLARWMAAHAQETFKRIVESVAGHRSRHGDGNGLAQSMHHTILPLARGRDKRCQVHWGIASFEYRFGYRPTGMWIPEMAVDYETLEVLSEANIRYVILSEEQVTGDLSYGAGPYVLDLPGGRSMAAFIRENGLSNALAFSMPPADQAKDWLNDAMTNRRPGALSLIATDGETFGHHHKHGSEVLRRLVTPDPDDTFVLTTLDRELQDAGPMPKLDFRENTAWSCSHHLGRWTIGCPCTPGYSHWKGALRRALDNLSRDIDEVYVDVARKQNVAPWQLRDNYIHILLDRLTPDAFLIQHDLAHITSETKRQLLSLLEAQVYRQRMFVSCAFFFEDLERIEPRYAIASAVQAIALVCNATGDDLTRAFARDLSVAISPLTGRTGRDILDELLAHADFGKGPLGENMALSGQHDGRSPLHN